MYTKQNVESATVWYVMQETRCSRYGRDGRASPIMASREMKSRRLPPASWVAVYGGNGRMAGRYPNTSIKTGSLSTVSVVRYQHAARVSSP